MRNVVSAFRRTLRLQAIATLLVPGLVATVAGCVLKKPPDAAAIKEVALPAVEAPQWTAGGAGAGDVSGNWLATFRDDQLAALVAEAIAQNADLRVGASRVEQAQLHARLAGAKLWPSVDLLARGGGKLSGDSSGIQGALISANWEVDLWGRVRYGRAASAAQAPEFTVAALRQVYEAVWGESIDPRNFHRKATSTPGFLDPTGHSTEGEPGRPAKLFRRGDATLLNPPILRRRTGG